jgi:hypothetical protein
LRAHRPHYQSARETPAPRGENVSPSNVELLARLDLPQRFSRKAEAPAGFADN